MTLKKPKTPPKKTDDDEDEWDELKPTVTAMGSGINSASANTAAGTPFTEAGMADNDYEEKDGTSMSTPMVAGMAAIMLLIALQFYKDPYIFCGMLFGVKLFADMSLATRWGAVTDMGGRMIATLFAFTNAIAIVAGIVGEKVYGWVLPTEKLTRSTPEGWLPVFYIGIGMYICCAVAWLLVDCMIPVLSEDNEPENDPESEQTFDPDEESDDG